MINGTTARCAEIKLAQATVEMPIFRTDLVKPSKQRRSSFLCMFAKQCHEMLRRNFLAKALTADRLMRLYHEPKHYAA